ncbi:GNAT family N-acetyltransferase [Cellulomonas palmilytica]|uniref:GNAT family N-acetyltransferase n=1 Tax=Cellulomonas palmilytica TaxID=2608402 RepID=UPI001F1A2BE8|nr:GNAT family N-acetyltransferase [Cellulomonas palmilytica]UJP40046.1 GNAT family N-acetyltransferase [Cellulomonas palmilytica]
MSTTTLEVRSVAMHDPLVRPLLDELAHEYWTRYQRVLTAEQLRAELEQYPAHEFAAPDGDLLLLLEGGRPVAGGAFRRRVEPEAGDPARLARPRARTADGSPALPTAELKRIWTHSAHRRRGLARRVLVELEERARARGYRRIYLTTGPRQPEAAELYLATGYTPLFDPANRPQTGPLPFEKWLDALVVTGASTGGAR